MERLTKKLEKLKIALQHNSQFSCGLIIVDYYEQIHLLKEKLNDKVTFIDNCNNIKDIEYIKNRVVNGEKIIVSSLEKIYHTFSILDQEHNDGIYLFYQTFTNSYREQLLQNNQGQLYFILTKEQHDQFYTPSLYRDIKFKTLLPLVFDLTKKGRFNEVNPIEYYETMAKNKEYIYRKIKEIKK